MSVYRPELHVTAEAGILDAAAGILRDGDAAQAKDVWHIFYQYRATPEAPSRWGHSCSEGNAFDWVECNDTVVPIGGEIAVRAGSVVAHEQGADLYFTSVTEAGMSIQIARTPNLDALCEDVDDSYQVDPAVRRLGAVLVNEAGYTRFRSPCVVPDWRESGDRTKGQSGWLMLAMTGEPERPVPVVLSSTDGTAWTLSGPLTFAGDPGFDPAAEALVAPRIIRLRDEVDARIYDVLMFTLERRGKDTTGYIVGTLEGNVFTVSKEARRIDLGHDFTRPRSTNYSPGSISEGDRLSHAYIYGLMTDVGRGGDPTAEPNWEAEGWSRTLTLPRRITLQNGALYQTPPRGLPDAVAETERAHLWTGLCEIPVGSAVVAEVLDGAGEVAAVVTHSGDEVRLDRLDGAPASAIVGEDDEDNITIVVDSSTIEVFAGGGVVAMSSRFWPEGGCSGLRVTTHGQAQVINGWHRGA
ncbi:GH32 C-terminal domain-containing protein [Corynebacterium liangguodongii]|uniref:beta-fructofuranosidase n=1 Tax=Corynebacterium liangguodongii TaxID=2079535 RepID=A0A2S0WDQ3_9CORY|nr:GH32 C-terminal domain-containing protein [Corynebacterium liangguodongii]AWB83792.1 beta-fructosidase [Corynebacterium liangguodongii]PWB98913.1 beta-fructosidase [Corynebacterium liangguodongii]